MGEVQLNRLSVQGDPGTNTRYQLSFGGAVVYAIGVWLVNGSDTSRSSFEQGLGFLAP